jgi:hypothetical protein
MSPQFLRVGFHAIYSTTVPSCELSCDFTNLLPVNDKHISVIPHINNIKCFHLAFSKVVQRVVFLHEELMKLPSFPRKALEADLDLYKGGEMGKVSF